MSMQEEIAELCKTILIFQNDMKALREELFNLPTVSRKLIWNHVVGATFTKASGGQIVAFFTKHGLKFGEQDIELIMWQFSSNKDNSLSINDFWQIFKPLSIKFSEQIMTTREKKISIAKFHEAHYRISDLLSAILMKTLIFLRNSQKMKWNIVKLEAQPMKIQPLDPQHLQIYLNQKNPIMILQEVQIVFQHMMRNQVVCPKTFQEYFIPLGYKSTKMNPNFVREHELADELKGLELIKYHAQNVHYITQQQFKKALYLQTGTSNLSTQNSFKFTDAKKLK